MIRIPLAWVLAKKPTQCTQTSFNRYIKTIMLLIRTNRNF